MSRLYFHSEHGEAELRGSEHHWLGHIARSIATAVWDLARDTDRGYELMALAPEGPDYLHKAMRDAQAEEARNKDLYANRPPGISYPHNATFTAQQQFRSALETALNVHGFQVEVAGVRLHTTDVGLNTALACGSAPVQLAAKLYGWGEGHCWVDGKDRAWMADVIDKGLESGVLRRAIWYVDGVCDGPVAWHPDRKLSNQGWEAVQEFLRSRGDGPVVLSYSICDQFPNREIAGWEPPLMPEGWRPDWADGPEGLQEWECDYPDEADRLRYYRETAGDSWRDLPEDERWRMAMEGLERTRPWSRLSPEDLGEFYFGPPVTIYDLFAPDRDERVRTKAAD